jgi:hypothetical protein
LNLFGSLKNKEVATLATILDFSNNDPVPAPFLRHLNVGSVDFADTVFLEDDLDREFLVNFMKVVMKRNNASAPITDLNMDCRFLRDTDYSTLHSLLNCGTLTSLSIKDVIVDYDSLATIATLLATESKTTKPHEIRLCGDAKTVIVIRTFQERDVKVYFSDHDGITNTVKQMLALVKQLVEQQPNVLLEVPNIDPCFTDQPTYLNNDIAARNKFFRLLFKGLADLRQSFPNSRLIPSLMYKFHGLFHIFADPCIDVENINRVPKGSECICS